MPVCALWDRLAVQTWSKPGTSTRELHCCCCGRVHSAGLMIVEVEQYLQPARSSQQPSCAGALFLCYMQAVYHQLLSQAGFLASLRELTHCLRRGRRCSGLSSGDQRPPRSWLFGWLDHLWEAKTGVNAVTVQGKEPARNESTDILGTAGDCDVGAERRQKGTKKCLCLGNLQLQGTTDVWDCEEAYVSLD